MWRGAFRGENCLLVPQSDRVPLPRLSLWCHLLPRLVIVQNNFRCLGNSGSFWNVYVQYELHQTDFTASEDEGAVPERTTPFPDIIQITPASGLYPGLTPTPGREEARSDKEEVLTSLPVPSIVTGQDILLVPGLDLTGEGVTMAPTGKNFTSVLYTGS